MISGVSPLEHFSGLVASAMARQKVAAGELARFYLAAMLAEFINAEKLTDEPLATRYLKALGSGRAERTRSFKELGDMSLFISGFFSDSLNRKIIDVDYYINLGSSSYGHLAHIHKDAAAAETLFCLFTELSVKFNAFVDVLTEVSERTRLTSSTDVLRVYERWLRTRSVHAESVLRDLGIEPVEIDSDPKH